eukprot:Skav232027  [mRNA]  locus=scaffold541:117739:119868:+ [translate_table: standard]
MMDFLSFHQVARLPPPGGEISRDLVADVSIAAVFDSKASNKATAAVGDQGSPGEVGHPAGFLPGSQRQRCGRSAGTGLPCAASAGCCGSVVVESWWMLVGRWQ